jgi:hypothetical protein
MLLTLTDLPCDIHDTIAAFLPDKDLGRFVCASRQIVVSAYLLRQRQRAYWKKCGVVKLAEKGDLAGLQYLHGLGTPFTYNAMDVAAEKGHLAVVQFLHGLGTLYTAAIAMDYAALSGHLAVVQFLHSVGAPFTKFAMFWAKKYGKLDVVEFLQSVGVH